MSGSLSWTQSTAEIAGTKLHLARGGNGPSPCAAPRHRHPGPPAVLRQPREGFRRPHAASSRLRKVGTSGLAASSARHRRNVSVAARRPCASRRVAHRLGLRRLGGGGDGEPGADAISPGLVLVGPMGIKPPQGEILDQAIVSYIDYAARLPRPGGVRAGLRRGLHRPAGDLGYLPGDELPHRLEALHVQPDAAASAGRRAGQRRWSSGATRTRSCRAAPASTSSRRYPRRGARSSATAGTPSRWSNRRSSPISSPASSPRTDGNLSRERQMRCI